MPCRGEGKLCQLMEEEKNIDKCGIHCACKSAQVYFLSK